MARATIGDLAKPTLTNGERRMVDFLERLPDGEAVDYDEIARMTRLSKSTVYQRSSVLEPYRLVQSGAGCWFANPTTVAEHGS